MKNRKKKLQAASESVIEAEAVVANENEQIHNDSVLEDNQPKGKKKKKK